MKIAHIFLFGILFSSLLFSAGVHHEVLDGANVTHKSFQIRLSHPYPILKFASEELRTHLEPVTGTKIPVTDHPSSSGLVIVLGDCPEAKAAGADISFLPAEGYYIRKTGRYIYIAGKDSATAVPRSTYSHRQLYQRGTLSGVYDFLERFAQVRFFFPGKYGTITPQGTGVKLPESINIKESPDFYSRVRWCNQKTTFYEKANYPGGLSARSYNTLRLRLSENHIPMIHGLAHLYYKERFYPSHPEYFALCTDGRRYVHDDQNYVPQLCFSSKIVDEIYQDVRAFFQGKSPSARNIPRKNWHLDVCHGKYFSIMPHDAFYWCGCPACAAIGAGGKAYNKPGHEKDRRAINRKMWQFTIDIANRLTAEGIDGIVTQMPYGVMIEPPDLEFPGNVAIRLQADGLGVRKYWKNDLELIRKWSRKVKIPVSLWTYPGKHMGKAEFVGIPAQMHRQIGQYFQTMKPISGSFLDADSDYAIFNYLNFYVFAKVAWNNAVDVEELLKDHYRRMFGPGAGEMESFFDDLETLWTEKVLSTPIMSSVGARYKLPTIYNLWSQIYTPEIRLRWQKLLDRAEAKCASNPDCLGRIRFMKREYLGPILKAADHFEKNNSLFDNWTCSLPGSVWLRPVGSEVCEVSTEVQLRENPQDFIFTFLCEEPSMNLVRKACTKLDSEVYLDSCVEVFLDPEGRRRQYCHLIANLNGALYDELIRPNGQADISWNSNAKVKVNLRDQKFIISLTVPKKSLGNYRKEDFPVNFGRACHFTRKLPRTRFYQWSSAAGSTFHDVKKYGIMKLGTAPSSNLLLNSDFRQNGLSDKGVPSWRFWRSLYDPEKQQFSLDKQHFVTGGCSLHMKNQPEQRMFAEQKFKGVMPGREYRVSFMVRTKDVAGTYGVATFLYFGKKTFPLPGNKLQGDNPWHRLSFKVKAPADITPDTPCSMTLWMHTCGGEAWFDCIKITPIEP